MTLNTSLRARQGHGVSDEDEEPYILGYRDAVRDLTDTDVRRVILTEEAKIAASNGGKGQSVTDVLTNAAAALIPRELPYVLVTDEEPQFGKDVAQADAAAAVVVETELGYELFKSPSAREDGKQFLACVVAALGGFDNITELEIKDVRR